MTKLSRRRFIGKTAVGAVSLYALPGYGLVAGGQGAPRLQQSSVANLSRDLQQFIPRMMQHVGVPGLSIAVIRDAKIIWSHAFGTRNNETRESLTTDTPFEAASFSKAAFAYAVLKLCDRGKLSLDTPLWNYRPNYFLPEADPRSKLITTRMILSHTSGLHFRPDDKSVQIHSTPGEKWFYSPMAYGYLQRIVEHITGQPVEGFMQTHVLRPFGMNNSSYDWNEKYERTAAKGHDQEGKRVAGQNFYEKFRSFSAADKAKILAVQPEDAAPGAGFSLTTTPSDYARYLIEILKPSANDSVHLSTAMLKEMLKPQIKISTPINWGLGWTIEQAEAGVAFYHYGNSGTSQHLAVGLKEQQAGVVIMTNSGNGLRMTIRTALRALGAPHMTYTLSFA
ncbi:MAG TPA: serine hydrolase domain-containing protein [Pyrinomonadaceae bacterium]|nr:serine hydrolase domain-containing protein [Pyrinomonadaceae bacterium]